MRRYLYVALMNPDSQFKIVSNVFWNQTPAADLISQCHEIDGGDQHTRQHKGRVDQSQGWLRPEEGVQDKQGDAPNDVEP